MWILYIYCSCLNRWKLYGGGNFTQDAIQEVSLGWYKQLALALWCNAGMRVLFRMPAPALRPRSAGTEVLLGGGGRAGRHPCLGSWDMAKTAGTEPRSPLGRLVPTPGWGHPFPFGGSSLHPSCAGTMQAHQPACFSAVLDGAFRLGGSLWYFITEGCGKFYFTPLEKKPRQNFFCFACHSASKPFLNGHEYFKKKRARIHSIESFGKLLLKTLLLCSSLWHVSAPNNN